MGSCFSSELQPSESSALPTAHVVSINGSLRKYNIPVVVSQVLQAEAATASSSSSLLPTSIFLCNSDRLCYDDFIPPLDSDHPLQTDQIYFVLPVSKLQQRLSSSDMAALAVKASVAIQNASVKDSHRRKKARISPLLIVAKSLPDVEKDNYEFPPQPAAEAAATTKSFAKPPSQPGVSRSASIRKLQRYTSRRAKLAVRSFKLRLSTIYEGSVL